MLTEEERLLLRRCEELYSRADSGVACFSDFLNIRERFIIERQSRAFFSDDDGMPLCFFHGGYPSAERALLCFMPAYVRYSLSDDITPVQALKEELESAIVPIRIKTSGYVRLAHRDFLGALIGLGIDRSAMGDILPDSEGAIVFATPSVAGLITSELTYIGRDKVKAYQATLPDNFDFKREFEKINGTVASPRLDAVVAEIARTSRESAKSLISQGLVEHNHFTAAHPDREVVGGDIISVRKTSGTKGGKFIVDKIDEPSAKGRIRLSARRYI